MVPSSLHLASTITSAESGTRASRGGGGVFEYSCAAPKHVSRGGNVPSGRRWARPLETTFHLRNGRKRRLEREERLRASPPAFACSHRHPPEPRDHRALSCRADAAGASVDIRNHGCSTNSGNPMQRPDPCSSSTPPEPSVEGKNIYGPHATVPLPYARRTVLSASELAGVG